jgi:hypothetical protein
MSISKRYSYGILKDNYPDLAHETTLLDNDYKETKLVLIEKQTFDDGSEGINRIIYSDSYSELSKILLGYVSWYDYIANVSKSIQGYISLLN